MHIWHPPLFNSIINGYSHLTATLFIEAMSDPLTGLYQANHDRTQTIQNLPVF